MEPGHSSDGTTVGYDLLWRWHNRGRVASGPVHFVPDQWPRAKHGRGGIADRMPLRREPLDRLTPREREVLALMAQGRSNPAIARSLVITDKAVEKHVGNIFTKLDLAPAEDDHRRVLAVLHWHGVTQRAS